MKIRSVFIFVLLMQSSLYATDATVVMQDRISMCKDIVTLADAAYIYGDNPDLVNKLRSMTLCIAPKGKITTKVNRSFIKQKLSSGGIDLLKVDITGSSVTFVSTIEQSMINNPIAKAVKVFVTDYYSDKRVNFRLEFRHVPKLKVMPPGSILKVIKATNQKYKGNTAVVVGVFDKGKVLKKYPVSVRICTYSMAAMARSDIPKHSDLSSDHFIMVECETTSMRHEPVSDLSILKGMWTKNTIFKGSILTCRDIESKPLIEKGDVVTITAKDAAICVKTLGRARKSGGIGEVITVVNLSSRKQLEAIIVDENTVVVEF